MSWKRPIARLLNKTRFTSKLRALYNLAKDHSYLNQAGWFESFYQHASVDAQGNPIPWLTYPANAFISQRLSPEMKVFEYGSGNSTHWWAQRVADVVSCEHDKTWYEKVKQEIPPNVHYIFAALDDGYPDVILRYHEEFDIVIVDGRERVACVRNAVTALKSDGIIIWDNTDREKYHAGIDFLHESQFRQIDFWGPMAIMPDTSYTSIFYRTNNCFGI